MYFYLTFKSCSFVFLWVDKIACVTRTDRAFLKQRCE